MFKSFFRPFFHVFYEANPGGGSGGAPSAEDKAKAEADAKVKAQEELNQQFADRAARATEAERKRLLETLGVKDADEAAALLKIAREADDKTKTETERLQAQVKTAEDAKTKAETEAQQKLEAANKRLLDSEIKINASAAVTDKDGKVTRPAFRKEALEDVLLLIDRTKIDEKDGVYTNVEKALNDLAKAKPWLLEEKQQTSRGTPRDGGPGSRKQDDGERSPIIRSL